MKVVQEKNISGGSNPSLSATRLRNTLKVNILQVQFRTWGTIWGRKHA